MSDLFPTRDGEAQGHGAERTMADKVDASGFRTVIRNNPDGSVTMLRTRGGALHYSTTPAPATNTPIEPTPNLRGFVAHKTDASSGVAFDPTQWVATSGEYAEPEIIDRKFAPVIKTYYVSELTTDNNAVAAGTTQLQDVWTLTSAGLRINNIAPTFLGGYTLPTFTGIPLFIPIDNTYGTLAENAGQVKRIFIVGREKVEAVTDGTMANPPSVELCSKLAREEYRAMTCGPSIDRTENKAVLSQLFYTGHSWDSMAGGWAMGVTEVAMLLTPPYISQVDSHPAVTQASATPQLQAPYSGTEEDPIGFPDAEFGVYGVGELGSTNFDPPVAYVNFPWRGVVKGTVDGYRVNNLSGALWIGNAAAGEKISGVDVTVSATTDIKKLTYTQFLRYDAHSHQVFSGFGAYTPDQHGEYSPSAGTVTWSEDAQPNIDYTPFGQTSFYIRASSVGGSSTGTYDTQVSSASVQVPHGYMVNVSLSRAVRVGYMRTPTEGEQHYQPYVDNPYGMVHWPTSSGLGNGSSRRISCGETSGDPIYKGPMYAAVVEKASSKAGYVYYAYGDTFDPGLVYYNSVEEIYSPAEQKSLNWTTRDYLLYDDVEQVYVYVLGTFAGVNQDANLLVELVVKTRHHESRKTLYQTALWYFEMLPVEELEPTVYYVPLPRLSIFFTPKYRHQGDFRGAAYTTTTEEAPDGEVAGATPVCLMNFILTLQMFDYLGTQEQRDNLQKGVDEQFIPCNLLEMLYAYVFSSDYGQNEYSRYPVTYRNNFNKLYAELFNVQHPIAFKDGAFVDWAASITGHNPSTTTGIYRT